MRSRSQQNSFAELWSQHS